MVVVGSTDGPLHHRGSAPENLSQDPASDYFADGLTDEIIRNLSVSTG